MKKFILSRLTREIQRRHVVFYRSFSFGCLPHARITQHDIKKMGGTDSEIKPCP